MSGKAMGIVVLSVIGLLIVVAAFQRLRPNNQPEQHTARQEDQSLAAGSADSDASASKEFYTTEAEARQFVGNSSCLECHEEYRSDYLASGHARTIRPIHDFPHLQQLADLRFHDSVRGHTFRYHVEGELVDVSLPEVFGTKRMPLNYAFGSGDHAVTFVSLVENQDGTPYGIEHRVSWYSQGEDFDYTPRHDELDVTAPVEHFGRVVPAGKIERCIACHTTTAALDGLEVNRMTPNVGCESCHGPGADHVAAMNEGLSVAPGGEPNIRFASGTWSARDEIATCGKCHRTVDELPPQVLQPDEPRIIRFQSVGLVLSECYKRADGRLSCSTCHNPHQKASATSLSAYEQKCLDCHSGTEESVSCPVSPKLNCIECHMSPVEIHPGIVFHDHWIRVRDTDAETSSKPSTSKLADELH